MLTLAAVEKALDARRDWGTLLLRLLIGGDLIYGTQDNVLSWERMVEFERFLAAQGVPWPLLGAVVSAWAQFACGLLYVLGVAVRPAAAVMVINFLAALWIAHRSTPWAVTRPAVVMLVASLFFLLHGPGKLTVARLWPRKMARRAVTAVQGP